jgi:hypothetical protein
MGDKEAIVSQTQCVFCGRKRGQHPPIGGWHWQTCDRPQPLAPADVCSDACAGKLRARDAAPESAGDEWPEAERLIMAECLALANMLVAKNRAYGNSALDPLRVFSKAAREEQIRVRIDDKLSRLARGQAAGEDVELDLMGYFVLLRVARKMGSGQ